MTEASLQSDSNLGQYAAQVLDNPAYKLAWQLMRDEIVSAWSGMPVNDTAAQQLVLQQMKLLDRVQSTFNGLVQKGRMASAQLPTKADRDLTTKVDPSPIELERERVRRRRAA